MTNDELAFIKQHCDELSKMQFSFAEKSRELEIGGETFAYAFIADRINDAVAAIEDELCLIDPSISMRWGCPENNFRDGGFVGPRAKAFIEANKDNKQAD